MTTRVRRCSLLGAADLLAATQPQVSECMPAAAAALRFCNMAGLLNLAAGSSKQTACVSRIRGAGPPSSSLGGGGALVTCP